MAGSAVLSFFSVSTWPQSRHVRLSTYALGYRGLCGFHCVLVDDVERFGPSRENSPGPEMEISAYYPTERTLGTDGLYQMVCKAAMLAKGEKSFTAGYLHVDVSPVGVV